MKLDKVPEWAQVLRAAGHPVRLVILAKLLEAPKCVTAIRELLKESQPNVSQHLLVLKNSGLVASHRQGAFRCYYLPKPGQVRAIFRLLEKDYPTASLKEIQKKFRPVQDQKARR